MRFKQYLTEQDKITKQDLNNLEKWADVLFAKVNIDINFTKHFIKRVNDIRNKKQITFQELTQLFRDTYKIHGKKISKLGPEAEAVIKDMRNDINMPFVLELDKESQELDLIAKTIMRKKDFKTSNLKLTLERKEMQISAGVVLTDGTSILVAHPTGKDFWEVPKGLIEKGEAPSKTAVREFFEETGIKIKEAGLKFLEKFKLHKTKNVVLYIYKMAELPEISSMKCSTYMKTGKPEVDRWRYITANEIDKFVRPKMNKVLKKLKLEIKTKKVYKDIDTDDIDI